MASVEIGRDNTSNLENMIDLWNDTEKLDEDLTPPSEHAFTSISFVIGCCITIVNVTTMYFLLRHRTCIDGTAFWQQLVVLCFTDILSGISISLPPFGYLFFDININIYYTFCSLGLLLFPLSITLSAGNCCLISIHRYLVIKYIDKPITRTTMFKRVRASLIIFNTFLILLTVGSSVLVYSARFGFQFVEFCDRVNLIGRNQYKSAYIAGTVVMLTIFLIVTDIFNILSIKRVKSVNSIQPERRESTSVLNRDRQVTLTFIILVCVLNLTSIPSILFSFASINKKGNVPVEAAEFISRLIFMNSLFNPFIYSLRTKDFRSAVWNDVKCILSWISCSNESP